MQKLTPLARCGGNREIETDSERTPNLTGQIVNAGGDLVSTSVGLGRLVGSSENGGYQSGGGRDYGELDFGDRLVSGSIAVTVCRPVTNSVEIQKTSQARESRRDNGGFRTTVSGCGTGRARRSFSCGCNEAGQVQG